MKKVLLFIGTVILLTSCVTSTGVMPFGRDTFTVTVESEDMGMGAAQKKAISEATKFCQSQGRHFLHKDTSIATSTDKDVYSLTFKCVDENDPAYKSGN
jgi:hypothetical protein